MSHQSFANDDHRLANSSNTDGQAWKSAPRRLHRRAKAVEIINGDYSVDVAKREIHIPAMNLKRTIPNIQMFVEETDIGRALGCIAEYSLRYARTTITGRLVCLNKLLEILQSRFRTKKQLNRHSLKEGKLQAILEKILRESEKSAPTHAHWIKEINAMVGELASCGYVREFTPIPVPGGSRRNSKPRPDLIALHPHLAVGGSNAIAGEDLQAKQYLVYVNSLESLRRALEDEYITAKQIFDAGTLLLAKANPHAVDAYKHAVSIGGKRATKLFDKVFPVDDREQALANLLRIYRDHYKCKPGRRIKGVFNHYVQKQIIAFGGADNLCNHLTLQARTIAIVVALLQIDRYVNPSLALALTSDYESPTDDPNVVTIHSIKLRVGPEEIPLSLPLQEEGKRVSSATALRELLAGNQWVRDTYPKLKHSLFAYMGSFGPTVLSHETYAKHLRELGKAHGFSHLLSSSIRPAGAVKELGNGDLHSVAQRLQQANGSTSTAGYLKGAEFMLVARIRDFQENFQIGIIGDMPSVFKSLGYTPAQAKAAKERARRTGLGFFCRSPEDAPRKASDGGPCEELGKCATCTIRLFVADALSIAEQLAIDRIISKRMEELACDDPIRWESTWVNMLAFAKVVLTKVKSSHYSKHLRAAEKLADELIKRGYDPIQVRP